MVNQSHAPTWKKLPDNLVELLEQHHEPTLRAFLQFMEGRTADNMPEHVTVSHPKREPGTTIYTIQHDGEPPVAINCSRKLIFVAFDAFRNWPVPLDRSLGVTQQGNPPQETPAKIVGGMESS